MFFVFFKLKTAYEMRISDWNSDVCSSERIPLTHFIPLIPGPEPMTLKSQLIEDMKSAMKSGEKTRLGVIRLINAAIKQREVDERIELDDAQVLAVLEKMVKQRRDSISQFDAAGRSDLSAIEHTEMAIIEHYLPARLGEAAIVDAIDAALRSEEQKSE